MTLPSPSRASARMTTLALVATVAPSAILLERGRLAAGPTLFALILVAGPAVALLARQRPTEYRTALVTTLVIFIIGFVLGGIVVAALYLPAFICVLIALVTRAPRAGVA